MIPAAAPTLDCDKAVAERLLRQARVNDTFRIIPLACGRNNRIARLSTGTGDYFLKRYAVNGADRRKRLQHETAFCSFARDIGIDTVPELLAADETANAALYTVIHGATPARGRIGGEAVFQAIRFATAINRHRDRGVDLPPASEAAFTLASHYRAVHERFTGLSRHAIRDDAKAFLMTEVAPVLRDFQAQLQQLTDHDGDRPLSAAERCISPSDFGFHNAVVDRAGVIHFVDFEYAGWDDPARMICDFFLQVDVPVPVQHLSRMTGALAPLFGPETAFHTRIATLMPLYQVKWCCLLLNEFHPDDRVRRAFAGVPLDDERLDRQLALARARLADDAPVAAARVLAGTGP